MSRLNLIPAAFLSVQVPDVSHPERRRFMKRCQYSVRELMELQLKCRRMCLM